jgi:large subunit ribosomal protein L5
MFILEKYYNQVIKVDLTNKYSYVNFKEIPKIEKIILNFGCKNSDLFEISSALLFLELITQKKGNVTRAKRSNVLLKIRQGNIVGCTVMLTKNNMYHFLLKLVVNIFPNFRDFEGIHVSKKKLLKGGFSFTINDFVCFKELEKQFYLFPKLPPLNITFLSSNTKTENEWLYLLQSFKLPLLLKK